MTNSESKQILLEIVDRLKKIELFLPDKIDIAYAVNKTGLSRQAIRQKLLRNYVPEVDFWIEGNKIFMSRNVALKMLN